IYNFTVENFNVTGNTRAAFIAGQVQGLPVTIDGIVIKDSMISGSVDYVAGIVGRVAGTDAEVHVSNIVLDQVTIKGRYVAGVVADFNSDAKISTISDVWAKITLSGRESD